MSQLTGSDQLAIQQLEHAWKTNPRWKGIRRDYSPEEVIALRPTIHVEHTLARRGANRLWELLHSEPYVNTFGAMTGAQAVQMVRAGLKAIYLSGWQTAADANLSGNTYPDQSLYPSNSVPNVIKRLNNALTRADQINRIENKSELDWYAPIVADAEAGFGGPLHAFELMKSMIEAGAAGVHFEDQLAAAKKCGHLGGKVLVPTSQFIRILTAARLAADVLDIPTFLIARTDAESATLLTSDIDPYDHRFLTGERTPEGYYGIHHGLEAGIARALAYAPYADLLWLETKTPDLEEPVNLQMQFMKNIRIRCWPITALHPLTGAKIWMMTRSPSSSANWAGWDISSSSSRWRAGTWSTITPSRWRVITISAA
jgi:isocitrate lyase